MLEAKVNACAEKLPSWNIEFPNELRNWQNHRAQQIAEGKILFEKMASSAISDKPKKTADELIADIRNDETKRMAAFGSDHFVTTCLAIGRELIISNSRAKPNPPKIVTPAHPISVPPSPLYPDSARRQNQSGTVVLRLRVLRDGTLDLVSVELSSGIPSLDEAAVNAIRQSKWNPALTTNGQSTDSTFLFPVKFDLNN